MTGLSALTLLGALLLGLVLGAIGCLLIKHMRNHSDLSDKALQALLSPLPFSWGIYRKDKGIVTLVSDIHKHPFEIQDPENYLSDLREALSTSSWEMFLERLTHPLTENAPFLCEFHAEQTYQVFFSQISRQEVLFAFEDKTPLLKLKDQIDSAQRAAADWQKLLDMLPFPVWLREAPTKNLTLINRRYSELMGASPSAVLEKQIELKKSALHKGERHHFSAHGERHLFKIQEMRPTDSDLIIGIATDVTIEDQLQSALKRHTQSYNEILEYLSTGIVVYDRNMRLKFFNYAYTKMNAPISRMLHGEPHLSEVLDALRQHRLLPEVANFQEFKKNQLEMFRSLSSPLEEIVYLPNGRIHRTIFAPHPMGGLVIIFEDLTDKLSLESQYNTLIAVQKKTIDRLSEGVIVFSSDFRVKLANQAIQTLLKIEQENQLLGKTIHEIFSFLEPLAQDREDVSELYKAIISAFDSRVSFKLKLFLKPDRVTDWTYYPLPDGAHMVNFLDVTDSYQAERMLRERNEMLTSSDHLKSKFIANFSYELRSPLNSIVGFAEILTHDYFGEINEKQREYVDGILSASKHLLYLIHSILDLASMETKTLTTQLGEVNVGALLETVVVSMKEEMKRLERQLILSCPPTISMHGDPALLQQLFYHILRNALYFSPRPGSIEVSAKVEEGIFDLYVKEDGFEFSTDETEQRRLSRGGIGFALVKQLAGLHYGTVQTFVDPQVGGIILCKLPLTPPST